MSLASGSRLGPYEVLGPLGAGGMGEVYRARDMRLARDVAVKVLPEEFLEGEERKVRFEREAKLLASLNHPNIAAIYSFEEIPSSSPSSSSRHILVMELLEGGTLRERLRAGPLPPRKAIDAAVQMATALAAAHEKGIVHRDLKPENVFLTKDARVKILDFGLAKLSRREQAVEKPAEAGTLSLLTEAGSVVGTVGYMSPEQVRGEPVDFRSDLFSFGTVLHEMLSGGNPFGRDTQAETMTAILKEDPAPLSEKVVGIAPALSSIVGRCLEKEPDTRFHSAADLAFALETLAPASSPAATSAPKSAGRRPRRALVLLAILAAVGAGAFLAGKRAGLMPSPTFQRLTFRRGYVDTARFAPDGQSVIYAAAWEGTPVQLYSTRKGNPETTALGGPEALLLGVSSKGELALSLRPRFWGAHWWVGTLARAPLGGGAPREVVTDVKEADWSPDGSSLAAVRWLGSPVQDRLEFPLGTMLLESRGRLAQPRISRDGRLLAFLDFPSFGGQGSVDVIDREGRKRILSSGWAAARGLAWSPGGDEVWFTGSKSGRAMSLRAASLSGRERAVGTWGGPWILHDVSPDGRALLTSGGGQTSMIITTPSGERDLSWLDGSIAYDISADGRLVLFDERGEAVGARRVAYVRGTDGSPAVRLGEGAATALSPDKRWALVYRGEPDSRADRRGRREGPSPGGDRLIRRGNKHLRGRVLSGWQAPGFPGSGERKAASPLPAGHRRRPSAAGRGRRPLLPPRLTGRAVDRGCEGHRRGKGSSCIHGGWPIRSKGRDRTGRRSDPVGGGQSFRFSIPETGDHD